MFNAAALKGFTARNATINRGRAYRAAIKRADAIAAKMQIMQATGGDFGPKWDALEVEFAMVNIHAEEIRNGAAQ